MVTLDNVIESSENLGEVLETPTPFSRRDFFKLFGGLSVTIPFASEAESQRKRANTLEDKALLYDVYLSSNRNEKNARAEAKKAKNVLSRQFRDHVIVIKEGDWYKVLRKET